MANQDRFHALDGLRGIAAMAVVVHHILLASTAGDAPIAAGSPGTWLATNTPLHALWAGTEAVYLFFVLSGFVLTLPFVRINRPSWLLYYPKRVLRLYLPVWASVALALILAAAVPRTSDASLSDWANKHSEPVSILRDFLLLSGTDYLNSPLWSLRWEVLFSLLLPAYVFLALKAGRYWQLGVLALLAIICIGDVTQTSALTYLPMFGIGALVAVNREALFSWSGMIGKWGWAVTMIVALVIYTAHWIFPGIPGSVALSTAGGTLIVLAFLYCQPAVTFGSLRLVQWLGSRSFSLYLVHEPIVVSTVFGLHTSDPVLVASVALPVSLIVTEVFWRIVERPSHRLASIIGKAPEPVQGRHVRQHLSR